MRSSFYARMAYRAVKQIWGIEVICAGNIARSPIAEAVGNSYVAKRGLTDRLLILSSGMSVDTPPDFNRIQRFITLADRLPTDERFPRTPEESVVIDGVIYDGEAAQRYAEDEAYCTRVNELTERSREDLRRVGRTQRDAVLAEVGLQCRSDMKQTVLTPDISLILGLDRTVASAARFIYGSAYPIYTLGEYAGSEPDVEDPVGVIDLEVYRALRDQLTADMQKAVDRFAHAHQLG